MAPTNTLENFFSTFQKNIIGHKQVFNTPFGEKEIMYADWTASGRAYQPIEDCLRKEIMPFIGNTHTGATVTGTMMGKAYESAKRTIKGHVNASGEDVLVFCGSGMTSAVNKLQRILGIRLPGRIQEYIKKENGIGIDMDNLLQLDETLKPVVFITYMEHHSNHISWLETIANVEIIRPCENGNVDLQHLKYLLQKYKHRKNKIAAVTACSNVTGIETPYHTIAKMLHEHDGLCFVDFACSAPYVNMDMHPTEQGTHLDAIYFSPHKFLGGPGTPGVLIFNNSIYKNSVPDQPGGGTVVYTNPWSTRVYTADIESREDGGTPPFLQGIKAAMCIKLKEQMGVGNMRTREEELLEIVFQRFSKIKNIEVLEGHIKKRLGVISFIVKDAHYNLIVKILNDRFGIQTRGGCSCAGTYGHVLLNVGKARSYEIFRSIQAGDMSCKPGWVRLSIHPTMRNEDIDFIMDAIENTARHYTKWMKDYVYNAVTNEFAFNGFEAREEDVFAQWFAVQHLQTTEAFV